MEKSKRCFFLRYINSSILEAWAKITDDIAKTALIATPSPFFYYDINNEDLASVIVFSVVGLFMVAFTMLLLGAIFRNIAINNKEK